MAGPVDAAIAMLREIRTGSLDRAQFTPDASWWWNNGQRYSLGEFLDVLAPLHALTEAGVVIEAGLALHDGDHVVVEATSQANLRDGGRYANRYLFLIHFDGDLIREVREYSDTAHVARVFGLGA